MDSLLRYQSQAAGPDGFQQQQLLLNQITDSGKSEASQGPLVLGSSLYTFGLVWTDRVSFMESWFVSVLKGKITPPLGSRPISSEFSAL